MANSNQFKIHAIAHNDVDALRRHTDIPSPLPFQAVDENGWRQDLEIGPDDPFPPSLLIAVTDDDQIAGIAVLIVEGGEKIAGHRFTGTAHAWRGRGLATALKVATIRWAAVNDIALLRASNDGANDAMRAVNTRLDYQEQFRIVMFQRAIALGRNMETHDDARDAR